MPCYYFKVRDRFGELLDPDGRELPDLAAVRQHALVGARSLICDDVTSGVVDLNGSIEVSDEQGERVLLLPFDEAVTLVA